MNTLKIKEAVKKEIDGYCEQKKRKLIIRFMLAFAFLIAMNFSINCLKLFRTKKDVLKQEAEITKKTDLLTDKPQTHKAMMNKLHQMKTDIQTQRKSYEKTVH